MKEYEILKDHGELHLEKDRNKIETLVLDHYKKYYRLAHDVQPGAGWLSPLGKFYPCKEFEHDGLAHRICRAELGVLEGTNYLEKKDWVKVYEDGLVPLRNTPTQQQRNTLWDLLQASDEMSYKEYIKHAISR